MSKVGDTSKLQISYY